VEEWQSICINNAEKTQPFLVTHAPIPAATYRKLLAADAHFAASL
jgi:hypothetical protein